MKGRNYDVCIVGGLGHVGLPFGIHLAASGKKVVLYDINLQTHKTVSEAKMPFRENGAESILEKVLNKNLFLSTEKRTISESRFVVVVIGTDVDDEMKHKYDLFRRFFDEILEYIDDGQHVILRSTVFPGTTERIRDYLKSEGKSPRITFSPERISEGRAMDELRTLPQIIGAFRHSDFEEARELFLPSTGETIELSPKEAELAKLFTNAWRYILFSISNQFYQIATDSNLDFYKIYDAITLNYPRTKYMPRAGFAAGPCLFKDTVQLSSYANNEQFLGNASMGVNEGLPAFIIERLKKRYPIKEKVIGILGMTFKADSDDTRSSLAMKLRKLLMAEDIKGLLCSDVHLKGDGFVSTERLIAESDIIIIGAPHSEYADLDLKDKVVVDVWNYFKKGGLF
ncbi:MAG: nucleotide sugar dehydrogenase [Candidatus Omnitrophica bacterium]|nr:nucleotide sugar dehydrogenase [Candidatus Omnitrophota bacterium]